MTEFVRQAAQEPSHATKSGREIHDRSGSETEHEVGNAARQSKQHILLSGLSVNERRKPCLYASSLASLPGIARLAKTRASAACISKSSSHKIVNLRGKLADHPEIVSCRNFARPDPSFPITSGVRFRIVQLQSTPMEPSWSFQ